MNHSSIRQGVNELRTSSAMLVVNAKTMADYAARIARQGGRSLSQRKVESGGWEIRVSRRKKS
jgi:hypothetical protein